MTIVKEPVVKVRDSVANLFCTVNGTGQKSCGDSMWSACPSPYAWHNIGSLPIIPHFQCASLSGCDHLAYCTNKLDRRPAHSLTCISNRPPPVGSRTGAHCRRRVSSRDLSIAQWVHSSTLATFPAPATSNGACGFPALRFPVRFMPRVMRPIRLGALSASVVSVHASDAVGPSFPPNL
jgi:hypothetical protein